MRVGVTADRAQFYREMRVLFFGANRRGHTVSRGTLDAFWLQAMQSGHPNQLDCIKAFSETDFTEDLKRFDVPTLIVHGDDDQIVPIDNSARVAAQLIPGATLKVYPKAPHGLLVTHRDELNADLLAFLKDVHRAEAASP